MAGRGPAPKPASQRRNRNVKQRGEYATLKEPDTPPPPMPPGEWSERTESAWRKWWADPASTKWSPSDIDLVRHLADLQEQFVREERTAVAAEMRQVRDSLGLTPKGRQDRRWVLPEAGEVVEMADAPSAKARMEELRRRAAADDSA